MGDVEAHAAEGYPNEICGMLIAAPGSDVVTLSRRVRNINVERARDRYLMDPKDQMRIQRECDEQGLEIVGYYHSHPDHPARASVTDSGAAWAGPVYMIVSCVRGTVEDARGWVADTDGGTMHEVPVEVVDS
jgi:proteasome lid subunit RPN8/RPN11